MISPLDQGALAAGVEAEARRAKPFGWLTVSERAFRGWDNPDDDVWDQVDVE